MGTDLQMLGRNAGTGVAHIHPGQSILARHIDFDFAAARQAIAQRFEFQFCEQLEGGLSVGRRETQRIVKVFDGRRRYVCGGRGMRDALPAAIFFAVPFELGTCYGFVTNSSRSS